MLTHAKLSENSCFVQMPGNCPAQIKEKINRTDMRQSGAMSELLQPTYRNPMKYSLCYVLVM